jgi:hypothetical protein
MSLEEKERQAGYWREDELRLIRVFAALFLAFTLVEFVYDIVYAEMLGLEFYSFLLGIGRNLVTAYAITSFLLGFVFVRRFRGEGIVPVREITVTMVQVAVVVAVFFTLLLGLDIGGVFDTGLHEADGGNGPEMTGTRAATVLVGFGLLTFGGTLLAMAVVLVGGFGIMGMIHVLMAGWTPKLIGDLEGITRREDRGSRALMWFLTIPRALDTDVVLVEEPTRETAFPWDRFRSAVLWQVAFGLIIAVYVSLNPWLLRSFSMNQLFRFMSTAFVVIPWMVIPWFIHRRLRARFKGVGRDFHFYAAFKDRSTRLIIAGGTILIFVKLAWETSSVEDILIAFSSYVFIMVLCIVAFTFIYFDFFENSLAVEVHSRWRGQRSKDGGEGPEAPSVEEDKGEEGEDPALSEK